MDLTYTISIENRIFEILFDIIFCFSSLILNYWCSLPTLWNFQKIWISGKKGNFRYLLKPFNSIKNLLGIVSYEKRFCIESWQKFAYILCLRKAPGKKLFPERCWIEKRCWSIKNWFRFFTNRYCAVCFTVSVISACKEAVIRHPYFNIELHLYRKAAIMIHSLLEAPEEEEMRSK